MRRTVFSISTTLFLLCFFCLANFCCNSPAQPKIATPAFYHWQTQLRLTPAERSYLDSLGLKKLYVKFFDVDWDEATAQPVPMAQVVIDTANLDGLEIVPCIFITNRTFIQLQSTRFLAEKIHELLERLALQMPTRSFKEIQIDCDWTEQTSTVFFELLERLKLRVSVPVENDPFKNGFTLSCTIRLHQFKYPKKTGIPPVDRGMLMCYNMGDIENWVTENSILDIETAKSYLQIKAKYPLHLDIALPLFRWGVLFRDGQMIKLLNNLGEADLRDTTRFKKTAPNRFEVVKSTYLQAHYLYAGDQIRLEGTNIEALMYIATLWKRHASIEQRFTVSFYHLDTAIVRRFPKEKIGEVLQLF